MVLVSVGAGMVSGLVKMASQGRRQSIYHVEAKQKLENYGNITFQIANNTGADQTARMRRLVCAFVVRKQHSLGFSHRDPYDVEAQASWPPPGYAPASNSLYYLF